MTIEFDDDRHLLGVNTMDDTHREFIDLLNKTIGSEPTQTFDRAFRRLLEHTREHFNNEEVMMEQTGFPAINEHKSEHRRVILEMSSLLSNIGMGRTLIARAYVKERMPDWFNTHAATMDSALAAHIKNQ